MTYYCPFCWREVEERRTACPHCYANLEHFSSLPYEEKLLSALNHPVPDNRRMAIQILGTLKSTRALFVFQHLLESEQDLYVLLDVLKALSAIGTMESLALVYKATKHQFGPVKHLAKELLYGLPVSIDTF